jgi:hypothetical protein
MAIIAAIRIEFLGRGEQELHVMSASARPHLSVIDCVADKRKAKGKISSTYKNDLW